MSEKAARGLPGDTLGPRVSPGSPRAEKREIIRLPPEHLKSHILHNNQKKMNFERFVGAPVRNTRFCRKITGKGSIQDGGNVVIYKVESKKSLFRQAAKMVDFGVHFTPFWKGFG